MAAGRTAGAFSYSWGYQSGSRRSAILSSDAAAERQVELLRWYVDAARRAGYAAEDGPACEAAADDDADSQVREASASH